MSRVIIIDDSIVERRLIAKMLSRHKDIEVVGSAADPYEGRDKIVSLKPDVITLDINMPKMDGLSFLERLMKHYPLPVVVFSGFTPRDSELALKALDLGAMEVLCKANRQDRIEANFNQLASAVRAASRARLKKPPAPAATLRTMKKPAAALAVKTNAKLIAIGASTGGTQALQQVLVRMPENVPPILIVQHMPPNFTGSFARRLNDLCAITVREARNGDAVASGLALIAPGGFHMTLEKSNGAWTVATKGGPRVHFQRPAVDMLFHSVAQEAGPGVVGVLLTGMGKDGAEGLLEMKQRGAFTIAQDEHSCVVFGMPREAIKLSAADQIQPLDRIPHCILNPAIHS